MVFVQMGIRSASDIHGLASLALSGASLAEGRWWTLLTHIPFHSSISGQLFTFALTILAVVSVSYADDPRWMGGWRMPAVYLACAFIGGLAHAVAGHPAVLTGIWPGLLGLLAYYWASRRFPALVGRTDNARYDKLDDKAERISGALGATAWLGFVIFQLGSTDLKLPFEITLPVKLACFTAMAVSMFTLAVIGNRRLTGIVILAIVLVMIAIGAGSVVKGLRDWFIAWEALAAGVAAGALIGLGDRRGEKGEFETA